MTSRLWIAEMAKLSFALAFVVSMTLCSRSTSAQSFKVELKIIPPGHTLTLNSGVKTRYYLLNEWLQLAEADAELFKLRADIQDLGDINNSLKIQMNSLERIIRTLESDKEILRERGLRLEKNWMGSEKARVRAEGGPIWPYFVAIGGVVVGVLGVGMWAGEKLSID